jgi:hypothetical protein
MTTAQTDPRRFNIRDQDGQYLCPACGWPGHFRGESYSEDGGLVGTGICPCCLFEPGFDDAPGASADAKTTIRASIEHYRSGWVAEGMKWRGDPRTMIAPTGWDAEAQLTRLLRVFPKR